MKLVVVALESELPGELPKGYAKLVTGVGKLNAAISLIQDFERWGIRYDCVINYGTAGGLPEHKGNFYGVHRVAQRDMDCSEFDIDKYITPYSNDPKYIECNVGHVNDISCVWDETITCGSGDSFSKPDEEFTVIDMEAYALAKVCKKYNLPFYCFKYVTDSGCPEEWDKMKDKGARYFKDKVLTYNEEMNT